MVSGVFLLGLAALLLAPGPTNTLLSAAGATAGLRAAPKLLGAEAGAYVVAVTALGTALHPVVERVPWLGLALQGLAAFYLTIVAVRLWRGGARTAGARLVTPGLIATTTLTNPKTLIIAFGLMPDVWGQGAGAIAAHVAALALATPIFGGFWMVVGRMGALALGSTAVALVPRLSAVVLMVFAGLLAGSALAG